MKLRRIDHIGIIVDDLAEAERTYRETLGLTPGDRVERENLRAVFYDCGGTEVELVEVIDPEQRRERLGDGSARIEHVAFEVDDLDEVYAALAALGVEAKGEPVQAERYRTFFTRPETLDGVGYQFLQRVTRG